jgi:hypothetical protein
MLGAFENAFKDATKFLAAPGVKANTMCVAIDRIAAGDFVLLSDQFRTAPADEVSFNCVAMGMEADATAASVTGEIRRKS